MKSAIIIEILILISYITIMSILVINTNMKNKNDLNYFANEEMKTVFSDLLSEKINIENLENEIEERLENTFIKSGKNIKTNIKYISKENGIFSFEIENVYSTLFGIKKRLYVNKTYILDLNENGKKEIRQISKEFYKDENGFFVSEKDGGLSSSSIFRNDRDLENILDEII